MVVLRSSSSSLWLGRMSKGSDLLKLQLVQLCNGWHPLRQNRIWLAGAERERFAPEQRGGFKVLRASVCLDTCLGASSACVRSPALPGALYDKPGRPSEGESWTWTPLFFGASPRRSAPAAPTGWWRQQCRPWNSGALAGVLNITSSVSTQTTQARWSDAV